MGIIERIIKAKRDEQLAGNDPLNIILTTTEYREVLDAFESMEQPFNGRVVGMQVQVDSPPIRLKPLPVRRDVFGKWISDKTARLSDDEIALLIDDPRYLKEMYPGRFGDIPLADNL